MLQRTANEDSQGGCEPTCVNEWRGMFKQGLPCQAEAEYACCFFWAHRNERFTEQRKDARAPDEGFLLGDLVLVGALYSFA